MPALSSLSCRHVLSGPRQLPMLWSHVPSMDIVSYTSNIPNIPGLVVLQAGDDPKAVELRPLLAYWQPEDHGPEPGQPGACLPSLLLSSLLVEPSVENCIVDPVHGT